MSAVESQGELLADLAQGGFAESLTEQQRRAIHIPTDLDDYLDEALENGKQIVLTGNPGDGKTQHILMQQDHYPADEYFYLLDASEYTDYTELLDEWNTAYEDGTPGVLAINDGPLYEMTTSHQDEYPFLKTVQTQLENQLVFSDSPDLDINFDEIVVIDLNNRNILTPRIIREALERFTTELAPDRSGSGPRTHIGYNIEKLQNEAIRTNLEDLLKGVGRFEAHITIRDLLNFLSYCITGGEPTGLSDFGEGLKYYNLAFTGEGRIFSLLREHFSAEQLTHPFIDSKLWAMAEQDIGPRDTEDRRIEIEEAYRTKKRQFLFEDEFMDLGYEARSLYNNIDYDFTALTRQSPEGSRGELLRLINQYFVASSRKKTDLDLWMSHRYRSKSSQALISRTSVSKFSLEVRKPRLHPEIAAAIDYYPTFVAFEYTNVERPIRLRVSRQLYQSLSALDANVPYRLRDRNNEQQLLEFMSEIEYHELEPEDQGQISIKDTETGRVTDIEVNDDTYRLS